MKYQDNLKILYNYCLVLSRPPEMKHLPVLVKISWKTETEIFPQNAISHES